jgi:hypothetical protein
LGAHFVTFARFTHQTLSTTDLVDSVKIVTTPQTTIIREDPRKTEHTQPANCWLGFLLGVHPLGAPHSEEVADRWLFGMRLIVDVAQWLCPKHVRMQASSALILHANHMILHADHNLDVIHYGSVICTHCHAAAAEEAEQRKGNPAATGCTNTSTEADSGVER